MHLHGDLKLMANVYRIKQSVNASSALAAREAALAGAKERKARKGTSVSATQLAELARIRVISICPHPLSPTQGRIRTDTQHNRQNFSPEHALTSQCPCAREKSVVEGKAFVLGQIILASTAVDATCCLIEQLLLSFSDRVSSQV